MNKRPLRWKCQSCDWVGTNDELLRAKSPFDIRLTIYGCPECNDVNCFVPACDEPGCMEESSAGWIEDGIYRRTCYRHSRNENKSS